MWSVDDETIRSQSESRSNEDNRRATLSLVTGRGLGWDLGKDLVGFGPGWWFVISLVGSGRFEGVVI